MRARYRYAREKLGVAVWKLATGIDGIKGRLVDAYIELAILQETDLPPELVDDWSQIKSDLTRREVQFETRIVNAELVEESIGRVYPTLRYMRKAKAQDIAIRICRLEAMLDSYLE